MLQAATQLQRPFMAAGLALLYVYATTKKHMQSGNQFNNRKTAITISIVLLLAILLALLVGLYFNKRVEKLKNTTHPNQQSAKRNHGIVQVAHHSSPAEIKQLEHFPISKEGNPGVYPIHCGMFL